MRARYASSTEVDRPGKRTLFLVVWYLAALALATILGRAFADADAGVYDSLLRLKCSLFPSVPDRRVVTVDMDDASLLGSDDPEAFRSLFAQVVDSLAGAAPRVIAADLVFKDLRDPAGDRRLAASIRGAGTVILPLVLDLRAPATPRILLASNGIFRAGQAGAAHINLAPDSDGVYRRYPLAYGSDDNLVPSLALAAVASYFGVPAAIAYRGGRAILNMPLSRGGSPVEFHVPLDREGLALIPFRGGWEKSVIHLSAGVVAAATKDDRARSELRDIVEGAIVLIGDTSSSGKDYGAVPVGTEFPLVGVHAAMIRALLAPSAISPASALGTGLSLLPILFIQWLAMGVRRPRDSGILIALSLLALVGISLTAFLLGSTALHWSFAAFAALFLAGRDGGDPRAGR